MTIRYVKLKMPNDDIGHLNIQVHNMLGLFIKIEPKIL